MRVIYGQVAQPAAMVTWWWRVTGSRRTLWVWRWSLDGQCWPITMTSTSQTGGQLWHWQTVLSGVPAQGSVRVFIALVPSYYTHHIPLVRIPWNQTAGGKTPIQWWPNVGRRWTTIGSASSDFLSHSNSQRDSNDLSEGIYFHVSTNRVICLNIIRVSWYFHGWQLKIKFARHYILS